MVRVKVICEGKSEQAFLERVLATELLKHDVYIEAPIVGRPGHKGGRITFDRMFHDIDHLLKSEQKVYVTTMIDYYGMNHDFPGRSTLPPNATTTQKKTEVERCFHDEVVRRIDDRFRPDRFFPYIQMYELEALHFSDPEQMAISVFHPELSNGFSRIVEQFDYIPEEINDSPHTAPSKRIIGLFPEYANNKPLYTEFITADIGISKISERCQYFCAWYERLRSLQPIQ